MNKEVWLLKSEGAEGFAVFLSRGNEANLCVLPYSKYSDAVSIQKAYARIGYNDKGLIREGDML